MDVSEKDKTTEEQNSNSKLVDVDEYIIHVGEFGKRQVILQIMLFPIVLLTTYQLFLLVFVGNNPAWRCTGLNPECNNTGQWDLVCKKREFSYFASSAYYLGGMAGTFVIGHLCDRFAIFLVYFGISFVIDDLGGSMYRDFILAGAIEFPAGVLDVYILALRTEVFLLLPSHSSNTAMDVSEKDKTTKEKNSNSKLVDVDEYIIHVGEFGKRQIILQIMLFPIVLMMTYQFFLLVFVGNNPAWRCTGLNPECNNTGQWDLVCKKREFSYFASSAYYLGGMAGTFVIGHLCDRFVPESVRWLRVNGRLDEAEDILRKTAKVNGRSPPCVKLSTVVKGTRNEYMWSRVLVGLCGKFAIALSLNTINIWSVERVPTMVRSQGMCLLTVVGNLGSFCAPWIAQWLKHFHAIAPYVVMGATAIIATALCFLLSETNGEPTKEVSTIDERENVLDVEMPSVVPNSYVCDTEIEPHAK
eukprot:gene1332-biopygen1060